MDKRWMEAIALSVMWFLIGWWGGTRQAEAVYAKECAFGIQRVTAQCKIEINSLTYFMVGEIHRIEANMRRERGE